MVLLQIYATNDPQNDAHNNNDTSISAAPRKDRSDSLKENEEEPSPAIDEHKKKRASSKQSASKRPLNHSLSAPVFPGYEAASEPSLAASWMIDHQPVSWSPGMMKPHAAGVRDHIYLYDVLAGGADVEVWEFA